MIQDIICNDLQNFQHDIFVCLFQIPFQEGTKPQQLNFCGGYNWKYFSLNFKKKAYHRGHLLPSKEGGVMYEMFCRKLNNWVVLQ